MLLPFTAACSLLLPACPAQNQQPPAASAPATVQTDPSAQAPGGTTDLPLTGLPEAGRQSTELDARIAQLLHEPAIAGAHWGIAVSTLDGKPLYAKDANGLFRPASTAKLFTTAAAMALLGPDATVDTTVSFPAPDTNGTVQGNLTIVGQGDANLGAHDVPWMHPGPTASRSPPPDPLANLNTLAAQVAARGVRRITGSVLASSWPWDPYPQGWEADDLLWGYGAPVAALSLADNTLRLTVAAGTSPSEAPVVSVTPPVNLYRLVSTVHTTAASSQPPHITLHHIPGDGTLRIDGLLPAGKTYTAEIAVDDPPAFAALALRQALIAEGVLVDGGTEAPRTELAEINFLHEARQPLATSPFGHSEPLGSFLGARPVSLSATSPTLQADIVATLKESLNLHAELMLRRLARTSPLPFDPGKSPAVEGARVLHQWLLDRGLSEHDFALYDGSGLSTKDLVTPRAETQLLAYAVTQPWFSQWKTALPVGGVDGTLASRFTQPPLKGNVIAKTGTLGESRALAGYLRCRSGREVIFAILDDNHEPGSSADRVAMDRIVEAVADLN